MQRDFKAEAGWAKIGRKRCFFRSRFERRWAQFLEAGRRAGTIRDWEYEPETFWFDDIKRGVRSYKPDFLMMNNDGSEVWMETKGYLEQRDVTKLRRFKSRYGKTVVLVLQGKPSKRRRAIVERTRAIVDEIIDGEATLRTVGL